MTTRRTWTDADLHYIRLVADQPLKVTAAQLGTSVGMVNVLRQRAGVNTAPRVCPECQVDIPPSTAGRRGTYCSAACRTTALMRRRKEHQVPRDTRPLIERPCASCGVRRRHVQRGGLVRTLCRECDNAYQRSRIARVRSERRSPDKGV